MHKKFFTWGLTCLLSFACCALAWAYNPGQRTYNLVGNVLNSEKQPLHLVVEQTIDLKELLVPEAYAKLEPAKRITRHQIEYNEDGAQYMQRNRRLDGNNQLLSDTGLYVQDGYVYYIDYLKHQYDRLPAIEGLQKTFAQSLLGWFSAKPLSGVDELSGEDFDAFTQGKREMRFYFQPETALWTGYQFGKTKKYFVLECSHVLPQEAFTLNYAGYQQISQPQLRARAEKLLE